MPKAVYSSPARGTPFKYADEYGARKGRIALVKDLLKDIIKIGKKFEKKKSPTKLKSGRRHS
jgi:hypothetical protein